MNGTSIPKALGPNTSSASGVRIMGGTATPMTVTRWPYRSISVVIGSAVSLSSTQIRSGTIALIRPSTRATRFSF